MSNRTAGIIDAEIDAIKVNNPNWLADIGDKALITALTVEKNQLAPAPGNYPVPVYFIVLFLSHILHICILFAFDECHLIVS
jgi:hypothetical protein